MKSDLVDLVVVKHHETELAWLVSDDGDRDHAVWIPKSQAELEQDRQGLILTCPERLAIEKGLV